MTSDPDRLDLEEVRRFLARRWRLIVGMTLGCAIVALAVTLSMRPTYTAMSQVLLDPHRQHVFGQDAVQPDAALDSAIVDSQISIITSTRLLAKLIAKENLAADPEFAASDAPGLLGRFLALFRTANEKEAERPSLDGIDPKLAPVILNLFKRIEVVRIAKSYVLSLSVSSRNAAKATRLANALAETFVEDRVDVHAKSVGQAAAFFEDRLGSLRDQVRASERAVADFRKKHDLTTTTIDGRLTVGEQQLQHLNEQLALAATDSAEKLARYQQAARFTSEGANTDTLPEVVRSTVITQLRAQQADLMRRESDLSAAYGPAYPAITQIHAQKAGLERAIAAEIRRLLTSLRNDHEIAAAREAGLRKTIAGLSTVAGGDNDVGVQLRELERTNMANQALFENFLNRAKLTQEQSSFEEPDARLISPALEPTAPSFPKPKLFVPLAGLIGLILGLGAAALRDRTAPAEPDAGRRRETAAFILGQVPSMADRFQTADQLCAFLARESGTVLVRNLEMLADKLAAAIPDGEAAEQGRAIALASLAARTDAVDLVLSLATIFGLRGNRVLLIDADGEARRLSSACGAGMAPGLAEVLADEMAAARAVVRRSRFALLPAGTRGGQRDERRLAQLLGEARTRFDVVLVTAPALAGNAWGHAVCAAVDGFAIVTEADDLAQPALAREIEDAAEAANFLGFVLTAPPAVDTESFALAS